MTSEPGRDLEIRDLVSDELAWTPDVDAAGIGVAVEDGAVILSGEVDSYAELIAAKRAALRVRGVRTLVDDLKVHPSSSSTVTATDIAREVKHALEAAADVPATVKAQIDGRSITLTGEVDHDYQRTAAKRAVQFLRGIHSVDSRIMLKARPSAADTEERIRNAITRNALLDARRIHVRAEGSKVVLSGIAATSAERRQAANTAWASPHVTDVDNQIIVRGY